MKDQVFSYLSMSILVVLTVHSDIRRWVLSSIALDLAVADRH